MLNHVIYVYGFNLMYAETLVKDLGRTDGRAAGRRDQPSGLVARTPRGLGRPSRTATGLESSLPDGWDKTFVTGGQPSGDRAAYPTKAELLDALKAQHARNTDAAKNADPATFGAPHPNEGTRKYFPTFGDMVIYLMTGHEMDHLGQIAAWRRAMGLGSATGI